MNIDKKEILRQLNNKCLRHFGCDMAQATQTQTYKAVCLVVRDLLSAQRKEFADEYEAKHQKQVYYMSMEFLVGTSLRNNLSNMEIENEFKSVLADFDVDIDELYALEPDAGLGNGGLGRLASCYLDSMTSLAVPAIGFSIRYEFGIFKQKIVDGWQMEFPDDWLDMGDVWLIPREEDTFEVKFGGSIHEKIDENGQYKAVHYDYNSVMAVPYDMMISGHNTEAVNKLVLWSAKSAKEIDMNAFSRGDYVKALEENTMAEAITKVLYPADDHESGKILRLKQQYILVSASLQNIIKKHMINYGTIENLADKIAIQINDTHPALCVPELMRILLDEFGLSWERAWEITSKTLAYTNHTVMSEALERWPEYIFRGLLPRIYQLVCEINRRLVEQLNEIYPGDYGKIEYMSIISNNEVRMANLCLSCVHKVNGVSKLHSQILVDDLFKDYAKIDPSRFTNVTNGIVYQRWLLQSNKGLTNLLEELIGSGFKTDAVELEKLMKFHDDKNVLEQLQKIKYDNKVAMGKYIATNNGVNVDPNSIFDIQIKRLHEYKRQLLNVLNILYMYKQIKENPNVDIEPRTFIFAAKASAGYITAKEIIRLIDKVGKLVNNDPQTRDKIKVVFLENYRVSLAEIIIPSADISEQISIAGYEASGTGNMKLMINGAVTLGTLDGANVEINEQVGDENMFLFGLKAHEVAQMKQNGYNPYDYYNANEHIRDVVEMLISGILGTKFHDIYASLLYGHNADVYMCLADFEAYSKAQEDISATYKDKRKFTNMSLVNIAKAGLFSSDRAIEQYAKNIWNVPVVK